MGTPMVDDEALRHHGDAELTEGLWDFAVNVFPGPPPHWLAEALRASVEGVGAYPDPGPAEADLAAQHGRRRECVLATAGAAEAFTLVARSRPWRRPVVLHPQFTEPHLALEQAGLTVTSVVLPGFRLDPELIPEDADLVVLGNPTNPTGMLHPAETVLGLLRPGRTLLVDEAFMDCVPGETESLAAAAHPGLLVARSLTKLWGIPGVRAGYLLGEPADLRALRLVQTPWSVSTAAIAAMHACSTVLARQEAELRARRLATWRAHLEEGLGELGIDHVPSAAPFVLARVGEGVHAALRGRGFAVRRADTFPGLDDSWVRIAVRQEDVTDLLLAALSGLTSMA